MDKIDIQGEQLELELSVDEVPDFIASQETELKMLRAKNKHLQNQLMLAWAELDKLRRNSCG